MDTSREIPENRPLQPQDFMARHFVPGEPIFPNLWEALANANQKKQEEPMEVLSELEGMAESINVIYPDKAENENALEANIDTSDMEISEIEKVGNEMETMNDPVENEKKDGLDLGQKQQNTAIEMFSQDDGTVEDGEEFGITPIQMKALNALLSTSSTVEASQTTGVGERTLRRWKDKDNKFKKALFEITSRIYEVSFLRTMALHERALQDLEDVIKNPTQPGASVKLRAIELILQRADRCYDVMYTKEKIERLRLLGGGDV